MRGLVIAPKSKARARALPQGTRRTQGGTGENWEQACTTVCDGAIAAAACLEFHRDWFAIGGSGFEELFLLEAEHPGQNVGRERLNLGVQVAHDGVVVAAGGFKCGLDFSARNVAL